MSVSDVLRLDLDGANELHAALRDGAHDLRRDGVVLERLLDDAGRMLGGERGAPVVAIRSAAARLDDLGLDLHRRLTAVRGVASGLATIDRLTAELADFRGPPNDAARDALERRRYDVMLDLLGGDRRMATRVVGALAAARDARHAVRRVHDATVREARIDDAMNGLGLDRPAATAHVDHLDSWVAHLVVQGFGEAAAAATVAIAVNEGLDLDRLLVRARSAGTGLLDAVGDTLLARSVGVTLEEYDALGGFMAHFDVLDGAGFGRADGRVTAEELAFVVAEPCFFTEAQVHAAEAMLARPALFARLDTAHGNADIFGDGRDASAEGFGRVAPGDGIVSADDLRSFLFKSRLHTLLRDHRDAIDVAGDPGGIADGYRSEADFRAFLDANPGLPPAVRQAATTMIEAGWFDESWWQEHKNDLALGAALLAGGIVVVATAGGASWFVVGMVSAAAAGGTTVAVNLGTDDELLDDVFTNSAAGFMVGSGLVHVSTGIAASRTGGHAFARLHGVAEAAAGATDVVMYGGLDVLLPEEWEDTAKTWVTPVNTVATALDVGVGGVADRLPGPDEDWLGRVDF